MISTMSQWLKDGRPFAIATVIKTWRSSPRQVGAAMLVSDQMEILGSVSGGCVESAVAKRAVDLIESGQIEVLRFGVSNEDAWQVGLSCGGGIEVMVRPFDIKQKGDHDLWSQLLVAAERDQNCSWIFALDQKEDVAMLSGSNQALPTNWPDSTQQKMIESHKNGISAIVSDQSKSYFLQHIAASEKLVVVGAAHISLPLVRMATLLGFRSMVIDPRGLFVDSLSKFCAEGDIHRAWPAEILPGLYLNESYYAVMLTHDPKIDDQALEILLRSDVKYIGALGSKKTHARRVERLQANGFTSEEVERIHAPVGLDIGALTPEEIALSVCAELIAVRRQILS